MLKFLITCAMTATRLTSRAIVKSAMIVVLCFATLVGAVANAAPNGTQVNVVWSGSKSATGSFTFVSVDGSGYANVTAWEITVDGDTFNQTNTFVWSGPQVRLASNWQTSQSPVVQVSLGFEGQTYMNFYYFNNTTADLNGWLASLSSSALAAPLTDVTLSSVVFSTGTLSPSFASATENYTLTVPYGTTNISFTPTTTSPDTSLSLRPNAGAAVYYAASGSPTSLTQSDFPIAVDVDATSGFSSKTYVISLVEAPQPLSTNTNLSSLSFTAAGQNIDVDPLGNEVFQVATDVTSASITGTTADTNAVFRVGGVVVGSCCGKNIALGYGNNEVSVSVTAEDGVTVANHTFTINRPKSADATLTTLSPSEGELSEAFDASVYNYSIQVPNDVESISLTTNLAQNATATLQGESLVSGLPSDAITLPVGSTTASIVVTAQDGVTAHTYNVIIIRAPSSNADLTGLETAFDNLTPGFSSGIQSYAITVDSDTGSIALMVSSAPSSTILVNDQAVTSGDISPAITLDYGQNTITVKVVAEDLMTEKTYTVTVDRQKSSDASLAELATSHGTLTPVFDPAVKAYDVTVPNGVTEVTLSATQGDDSATFKINGIESAQGVPSNTIFLPVGVTTSVVTVTAHDGQTIASYSVTFHRAASSNTLLSNLSLSSGTLTFDPSTYAYIVNVANDVEDISLTAIAGEATTGIKINGTPASSGVATTPTAISVGDTAFTIATTAQDAHATATYTLTVRRAASSNAFLSNLSVSGGTLAFEPNTMDYIVTVTNDVSEIAITATTLKTSSALTIDGIAVSSGVASDMISLAVGDTLAEIKVTAQDGGTSTVYKVTFRRAASSNVAIEAIVFSPQAGDLTPAFSPEHMDYTMTVANDMSSFSFSPAVSDPSSTIIITVNGDLVASSPAPRSASKAKASRAKAARNEITIPLNVGRNEIVMRVLAQDGSSQRSYRIVVTREASADATLTALKLSVGTISPVFSPNTKSYTANVDHDADSIIVKASATGDAATIDINGTAIASGSASNPITLDVGTTTVAITVTAEDGVTTARYMLNVTRASSAAYEFEQHKDEVRNIVRDQAIIGTRARLTATEAFSRQARDRAIAHSRNQIGDLVTRSARPLTWNGIIKANDTGATATGDLSAVTLVGAWDRFFSTAVDFTRDEDGSVTGTISARLAHEQQLDPATLFGFFVGADYSKGDIAGTFTGESESYDLSIGTYGVKRVVDSIWIDAFVSYGLGRNVMRLDNGALALDGKYAAQTFLIGTAVTGAIEKEAFELRPELAISHGSTWIGDVPFTATAFNQSDDVSLDAGVVKITRLQMTPAIHVPVALGNTGADAEFVTSPRIICEWSQGATSQRSCGLGLEFGFNASSLDGLTDITGSARVERVGKTERGSLALDLTHRF
ncbi:cadherin-like beta sandwich domain-containing protein [Loktanella sp. DJP18]|uniref:cadherin-like beta sandwich domain-containing protein n=1 Tax=Loktanella sp. DJP18 TaxID=3409788 RepID=UPI003BB61DBE